MAETNIEWADAVWNPVRGCSRVSEGCRHCYAERTAARFSGKGQPYEGLVKIAARRQIEVDAAGEPTGRARDAKEARWNGEVRFVAKRLADPLRWKKPRRIFVNSMSDLFYEKLTNEQIAAVFGVMAAARQHTFIVLTKRAQRMREWFEWVEKRAEDGKALFPDDDREWRIWQMLNVAARRAGAEKMPNHHGGAWPLPNVIIGVSVENQAAADERIPELLRTPAAVRAISAEPLLEPLDLHAIQMPEERRGLRFSALQHHHDDRFGESAAVLDWVIAGCESGAGARPCDIAWMRSLRDQCKEAGVPFFLKQAKETPLGVCGDANNPNGDRPCGKQVTAFVISDDTAAYSCGCTVEGSELGVGVPLGAGEGSTRKPGGLIGLPYLDGVQHAAFPEMRR